jgi:hypothetical protein
MEVGFRLSRFSVLFRACELSPPSSVPDERVLQLAVGEIGPTYFGLPAGWGWSGPLKNVCRILEPLLLKDGFRVLNGGRAIYFPSNGRQTEFNNQFGAVVSQLPR